MTLTCQVANYQSLTWGSKEKQIHRKKFKGMFFSVAWNWCPSLHVQSRDSHIQETLKSAEYSWLIGTRQRTLMLALQIVHHFLYRFLLSNTVIPTTYYHFHCERHQSATFESQMATSYAAFQPCLHQDNFEFATHLLDRSLICFPLLKGYLIYSSFASLAQCHSPPVSQIHSKSSDPAEVHDLCWDDWQWIKLVY